MFYIMHMLVEKYYRSIRGRNVKYVSREIRYPEMDQMFHRLVPAVVTQETLPLFILALSKCRVKCGLIAHPVSRVFDCLIFKNGSVAYNSYQVFPTASLFHQLDDNVHDARHKLVCVLHINDPVKTRCYEFTQVTPASQAAMPYNKPAKKEAASAEVADEKRLNYSGPLLEDINSKRAENTSLLEFIRRFLAINFSGIPSRLLIRDGMLYVQLSRRVYGVIYSQGRVLLLKPEECRNSFTTAKNIYDKNFSHR